jgi:hypothetical protein
MQIKIGEQIDRQIDERTEYTDGWMEGQIGSQTLTERKQA